MTLQLSPEHSAPTFLSDRREGCPELRSGPSKSSQPNTLALAPSMGNCSGCWMGKAGLQARQPTIRISALTLTQNRSLAHPGGHLWAPCWAQTPGLRAGVPTGEGFAADLSTLRSQVRGRRPPTSHATLARVVPPSELKFSFLQNACHSIFHRLAEGTKNGTYPGVLNGEQPPF